MCVCVVSDKHSTKRSSIIVADLQADSNFGLGITVSTLDGGGIIIQSMMKNGPAERDGLLHVGDHLNSIDGHSLEGATQAEADHLIQHLKGHVRVIASRPLSSPDLHTDRVSDYSRDYSRNTGSVNGGRGQSVGSRILNHPSVDRPTCDPDLDSVPELHALSAHNMSASTSQLATAEDHNLVARTGLYLF